MIILELSDIQLTKQANSAGLLRWQACRKIEVTQGPSRTGSFSHSTQLVNSGFIEGEKIDNNSRQKIGSGRLGP